MASQAGNVLWVAGAGSGMGRAVALSAARKGYRVALSGRRSGAIAQTAALIADLGGASLELSLDVRSATEVAEVHAHIREKWGTVSAVALAAGLNTPRRYWRDQSLGEFQDIVDTNLVAVAQMIDEVLPGMRERGDGVAVIISSYSGWEHSPDAGVAYSASKTALRSLTRQLNAQESPNGIRACHLCPGDVDTDFLSMRPSVPGEEQRQSMLTAEDVARAAQFVLDSPPHVRIDELVISPTSQR